MTNFDNLICVSKRENNPNRSFLFLNKYQAKYVATKPENTIKLFESLRDELPTDSKKTVVIGFAETATALGAIVAKSLGDDVFYIHSTREDLKNLPKLNFTEEHSHAKEHELCLLNENILKNAERFIFIDDEFTTGTTVCNFIEKMKSQGIISKHDEIIVSTLINCMKDMTKFRKLKISYKYLLEEYRDWSSIKWKGSVVPDTQIPRSTNVRYNLFNFTSSYTNIRYGEYIGKYQQHVEELSDFILHNCDLNLDTNAEVLILGTEECMYPAIYTAKHIKDNLGFNTLSFATSRSPIVPMDYEGYVLKTRAKIPSFYDNLRDVHLYNMKKYDKIIVITDAKDLNDTSVKKMCTLFEMYGNNDIDIVRWFKNENNI